MLADDLLEHKEIYYLQFKFLPQLFELYEDAKKIFNKFDESKIINIEFMKKHIDNEHIDWSNFKFEKKVLQNNLKEFIYDFGEPKSFPLCRYAIFFTNDKDIHEYLTLEKTLMYSKYPYLICSQKGTKHLNFAIECPANFEFFEKLSLQLLKEKYENYF